MSTVIEFRSSLSRIGPREDGPTAGEIIIFPGVRRERHTNAQANAQTDTQSIDPADPHADIDACEAAAKPKRQGRARPKRDRIELPD